jgi:hypothetical protein
LRDIECLDSLLICKSSLFHHGYQCIGNFTRKNLRLYVNPVNVLNILTKVSRRCQREALSEACLPQAGKPWRKTMSKVMKLIQVTEIITYLRALSSSINT